MHPVESVMGNQCLIFLTIIRSLEKVLPLFSDNCKLIPCKLTPIYLQFLLINTHPLQTFSVDENFAEESAKNFTQHQCHNSYATEVKIMAHFF